MKNNEENERGFYNNETGWEYNQSTFQSFYMFENLTVDDWASEGDGCAPNQISGCDGACCDEGSCGSNLNTCDVVGAFLNDVCIGWVYAASQGYTTVPVMGNDGTRWTKGYMEEGQLPVFKIYDASENITYSAVPSVIYPWTPDLNFYVISISVIRDCYNTLGGSAIIDDCGICRECETIECDWNASQDDCGICFGPGLNDTYVPNSSLTWETEYETVPFDNEFSATISAAQILIDGVEQTGGQVAAFGEDGWISGWDGDGATFFPPGETYVYEIPLWSHQSSGEVMTFKYYDSLNDNIVAVSYTHLKLTTILLV